MTVVTVEATGFGVIKREVQRRGGTSPEATVKDGDQEETGRIRVFW